MKLINILVLISAIFLILGGFVFGVYKYQPDLFRTATNFFKTEVKDDQVISKVKKLMDLPSDETPAIVSLDNVEKLKNQQFFKKAEVGDKVVIYAASKRAILYRPSQNKIIDVGVISINEEIKPEISPLPEDNEIKETEVETKATPVATSSEDPSNSSN